nr:MAG TPA: hypothetical protein [Caudoviricetes sp.]
MVITLALHSVQYLSETARVALSTCPFSQIVALR